VIVTVGLALVVPSYNLFAALALAVNGRGVTIQLDGATHGTS
jgi:hypothetical protein